ncbi:MAG TPA: IS481 family transposase [Syntrophobacteria bacterium]|nr:IS481 family transposase [Syntrophobacteria bacterium]
MTAEMKIAHRKLSLLELAEKLNNVSEACRLMRYSRSQFYEIKRAFQLYGFEGLTDQPPMPRSFPTKLPASVEQRVVELALEQPSFGDNRLVPLLEQEGIMVSESTVYNILCRNGLNTRYKRLLKLEERHFADKLPLTEEQVRALERYNPCFRERHLESKYPGYLLCQDTFYVGQLKGVGRVYLQVVVDTYGSVAFGKLYNTKKPVASVDLLYDRVLPFYLEHSVPVRAILTDRGTEFKGREHHPYELFLALNDIEHRLCKVRSPRTNGFVERFNRTALEEFFRLRFRKIFYHDLDELQRDLDAWLDHYNYQRPHFGYRNMGRTPMATFELTKHLAAATLAA